MLNLSRRKIIGKFDFEDVFPYLLDGKPLYLNGIFLSKLMRKYLFFFIKKGLTCYSCGRKGEFLIVSSDSTRNDIGVYSYVNGKLILFNRDHVIPASRGGSDSLQNLLPMCERCNTEKGCNIPFINDWRAKRLSTKYYEIFWKENKAVIAKRLEKKLVFCKNVILEEPFEKSAIDLKNCLKEGKFQF